MKTHFLANAKAYAAGLGFALLTVISEVGVSTGNDKADASLKLLALAALVWRTKNTKPSGEVAAS